MHTDVSTAASESAPGSASAISSRSAHGSAATSQLRERRSSRPLAHSDEEAIRHVEEEEENSRHDQPEVEQTRITHNARFQLDGIVPQPPSSHRSVTRSAQPADPPTSDYLVALAFQGWTEQDAAKAHGFSSRTHNVSAVSNAPRPDESQIYSQYHLPSYISPCPSHLDDHDLEYLARKDCLTIPDGQLRDVLIRIYVFVVYPFMPAIDLVEFLEPVTGSSDAGTISPLLFQAITFASVTFVDTQLLQKHGFESKRAARKVFFNRVKLLYGLDYEADRLTLVQSLLLMTYWYDSDSDDKHTWYWMGLAITTAHVEGLHHNLEDAQSMTKQGRLRRRTWWSCVIRDRLLGLGLRRPSRIRQDEFSVEHLRIDDFQISLPPPPAVARLLAAPSYTRVDPANRRRMATLCIDLSQLCITIGQILQTQYTIASTPGEESNYLRRAIEWFQGLAPESSYVPGARDCGATGPQSEDSTIRLHKILLYMKYFTAVGALHRPQVFYSGSDGIDPARKADSRRKLTEAAVAITKLAFDLQSNGQMCYVPTSSIPALLSAALIHLLNTRSSDEETRNISIGRFYQCLDALYQLQRMYAAADEAVKIINNMIESAGSMLPLLGTGNPTSKTGGSTSGDRSFAGVRANGVTTRNSRPSSGMCPSHVATAHPSPAPASGNLSASWEEMMAASIPGAGPTGGAVSVQPSRQPSGGPNMKQSATPNLMSIWSAPGPMHSERDMPLPADLMSGIQLDLDAWYDVGDLLDPALMDLDMGPDFWDSQALPM